MNSSKLTNSVFFLLMCSIFSLSATGLKEDFESYNIEKTIAKQGNWNERAYGRHPSCIVVKCKDKENSSKVLKAFGGGDRHIYKVFPRKEFKQLSAEKVFCLDFSYKGGTTVGLGIAAKYVCGKSLLLQCRGNITLHCGKKVYSGLRKVNARKWNEVKLIIEKSGKDALISIAIREKGKDIFIIDSELNKIKLPLNNLGMKSWNGLNIRLDGNDMLDDIKISSYTDVKDISDKLEKGKLKISFRPILEHITSPRKALDLSGKWTCFVAKDGNAPDEKAQWQRVIVPEDHSHLVKSAGKGCVFFRKSFDLADIKKNKKVFICFERVTDICDLYVNNKLVGQNTDGLFPFKFNISAFVKEDKNILTVKVRGPIATNAKYSRPQGWSWFYPKFAGIPYPVHLEITNDIIIDDVFIKPHVGKKNSLVIEVSLKNYSSTTQTLQLSASVENKFKINTVTITIPAGKTKKVTLKNNWKNPRLWWPHDPHLYFLSIKIQKSNKTIDLLKQRFGFREIRVAGKNMFLNNRHLLHRRDSIIPYYHRSIHEKIIDRYKLLKQRGFNGSRLHGGSNLRFIRAADEFGWLLSPESAINSPVGHQVSDKFWNAAEKHLINMVTKFRNHPSIIYWCLSNEFASYYMKGTKAEKAKVDKKMVTFGQMVEKIDPTRTWTCSGDGELGGKGKHGAAPTLSFHYAWQPFKQGNMIPNTVYWLNKGLRPWQGIIWDQKKPVMLSEDLYPPYALKPPHGMAYWGGDKAVSGHLK